MKNVLSFTLLFITLFIFNSAAQLELVGIPVVQSPKINENRVAYIINFKFNKKPENFWIYYDNNQKRLVVDFYSTYIEYDSVAIGETTTFADLKIKNLETSMSLLGKRSQISFGLTEGWKYDYRQMDSNILSLKVWKKLNASQNIKKSHSRLFVPLIISLISAGIASVTLILLLNDF